MCTDNSKGAAKRLAELTGRPVSDFDASEYDIPDFDNQEVKKQSTANED